MNTLYPPIVQAQLIVASKLTGGERHREINRIIDEARLYFPQCFKDLKRKEALPRTLTAGEIYINSLKTLKIGVTK